MHRSGHHCRRDQPMFKHLWQSQSLDPELQYLGLFSMAEATIEARRVELGSSMT